jgi:transposase-like protein
MARHLNPLEKVFLIRRYRSNQRTFIQDFCESNGITVTTLRKWMKQYDKSGLEGLAHSDAEIKEVLPEGVDRTEESYMWEILKLRIENERLKKSYAIQTNADGVPFGQFCNPSRLFPEKSLSLRFYKSNR